VLFDIFTRDPEYRSGMKKTHRLRLLLLALLSLCVFGAILARLYVVQIKQHESFRIRAEHQQNRKIQLIPHRGDIVDRNGFKLATSYISDTIYIDTRKYRPRAEDDAATLETDEETSETTTTSDSALVRNFKERLAKQRAEELVKDKAKAAALHAKRNKHKHKAWDELGVDPELINDLAAALCTVDGPVFDPEEDAHSTETQQATRMSMARARELVQSMFDKPRRHMFYRKAPETLSRMMAEIEARYDLPDGFVIYEKHSKRFYPNSSLASHIIGFTQIDASGDNIGTSGLEREYDHELKGRYAEQKIQISSSQRGLAPLDEAVIQSTYGNNVVLTIDQQLQMFTERALRTQVGRYQARGGIALVMDIHTGAILAMASCPDFDLNNFSKANPMQRQNRILTDPIEIGSVMKIITATLLIDGGLLDPDEIIDCSSPKVFGTRVVRDTHSIGVVPFRKAFAESSNVGLVTVGLRLEPANYYTGLIHFGLGQPSRIDLPGEGTGVLRSLDKWSSLSRSSLPMGYETSLTPMQVISALGAVANDGLRLRPHLLKEVRSPQGELIKTMEPHPVERVARPETCKTIRDLMEGVVLEGTGDEAAIPGYRIGGKTGTSVKYNTRSEGDDDSRKYYASFAGLLPIDAPRLAIYCYVDEPRGAKYGGTVAAPIFREIAIAAAHIFGIPPNDPVAFQQATVDSGINPLNDLLVTSSGLLTTSTTLQSLVAQQAAEGKKGKSGTRHAAAPATTTLAADAATTAAWAATFARDPQARPAPDLQGLATIELLERVGAAGLQAEVTGTGTVAAQDPPAGAPVHSGDKLRVLLMLPSQRLNNQAAQTIAAFKSPRTGGSPPPSRTATPAVAPDVVRLERQVLRPSSVKSAGNLPPEAAE
jgi:cell division protein FtsI/penicillin-binding protein 2